MLTCRCYRNIIDAFCIIHQMLIKYAQHVWQESQSLMQHSEWVAELMRVSRACYKWLTVSRMRRDRHDTTIASHIVWQRTPTTISPVMVDIQWWLTFTHMEATCVAVSISCNKYLSTSKLNTYPFVTKCFAFVHDVRDMLLGAPKSRFNCGISWTSSNFSFLGSSK